MSRPAERYFLPPLAVVEVTPTLMVVEPYAFDGDPNPRGLAVYHTPGTDLPVHSCAPRVDAICIACDDVFHLCMAWTDETAAACRAEIDAIKEGEWRCNECREVS